MMQGVICDSGAGEDVENFLLTCTEFERDRWALTDEVNRIVETGKWLEEYRSVQGSIVSGERRGGSYQHID